MKLARELEIRLERLVDGISAAIFGGRMHPVDLANRLIRQADLLVQQGPAGAEIPNHFTVKVNPEELDEELQTPALNRELALALSATAADRGWRTGGPVRVIVMTDPAVAHGSIDCSADRRFGEGIPWGQLLETDGTRVFDLDDNRVIIGRAEDVDIELMEPEISRHHALLFREAGRTWIADLGSANGTACNGVSLGEDAAPVEPGDLLTLGPTSFTIRLL